MKETDLDDFWIEGCRGLYRPRGSASTAQLADMITQALAKSRAEALANIIVNIAKMEGFDSPGPAYRRWAARRWAQALGPNIPIAMVARSEHICPEKTGLLIAAEEGMQAHICISEIEAISWLDATINRDLHVDLTPRVSE